MDYSVFLHPKADKSLKKPPLADLNKVREKLAGLRKDPSLGEQLTGSKFYKLRVGDYRAIYEVSWNEHKVVVLFIGHRSKVYDDFTRFL